MRHLFIINPVARRVRGNVRELRDEIDAFFRLRGTNNYSVYVTCFRRDAMGYTGEYAKASVEPTRIHVIGGAGTLYEVVNGSIGMPHVQIAAYPMGASNHTIHYFGADCDHLFRSIENQVSSNVTPLDAMRYGDNYGVGFALIGLEAVADREYTGMVERTGLPDKFCQNYTAVEVILNRARVCRRYRVDIDGADHSGEYVSILIAGGPCYGVGMTPAPEAHPNDGVFDVYLMKNMPLVKMLFNIQAYISGKHEKLGGGVLHVRGKRIDVSAEEDITMSLDGEIFFDRRVLCEIVPSAVNLVCPNAINVSKLPRVYKRKTGGGK